MPRGNAEPSTFQPNYVFIYAAAVSMKTNGFRGISHVSKTARLHERLHVG